MSNFSPYSFPGWSRVISHFVSPSPPAACHSTGVGLAIVVLCFVYSTYYNVLMSWALYYLFNSFGSTLPWMSCNNTWNVVGNCSSGVHGNATNLQSASQQFFEWEAYVQVLIILWAHPSQRTIFQSGHKNWIIFLLSCDVFHEHRLLCQSFSFFLSWAKRQKCDNTNTSQDLATCESK